VAKYRKKQQQPKEKPKTPVSKKETPPVETMEKPPTMEQKRAKHAWKKAQEGVEKYDKGYVNDAKGLPALIMNSGLMQVMAFLESKEDRHRLLGAHLRDWLHTSYKTPKEFKGFMEEMLEVDSRLFQAINSEAFAWLRWLRQFAAALPLKKKQEG